MKVTDPDVIKTGEKELIESIKDELDWSAVKEIFMQNIKLFSFDAKDGSISFDLKGGEIVVHEGQVAFRVDFELKTCMSIMFDRTGNHISIKPDSDYGHYKETASEYNSHPDSFKQQDNVSNIKSDSSVFSDKIDDSDEILDDLKALEDDDILRDNKGFLDEGKNILTDEDSVLIDEDGVLIDEDGVLIDEDGVLIDEDGDILEEIQESFKEDEDTLGDMDDDNSAVEFDPIADLNKLTKDDELENILKDSRDFWVTQEK